MSLVKICPACETENPLESILCSVCGSSLAAVEPVDPESLASQPPVATAETGTDLQPAAADSAPVGEHAPIVEERQNGQPDEQENSSLVPKTLLGMAVKRALPAVGGQADIFLVDDGGTDKIVKLYRLGRKPPEQEVADRYNEIANECPEHIVRQYANGYDDKTQRFYAVQEYVKYGTLDGAIRDKTQGSFDFEAVVKELAVAIESIHSRGLVHRDIKPENIFIRSFAPLNLVLGDFGISSIMEDDFTARETARAVVGMYNAPEEALGEIVTKPADWWALGVVLLEFLTGRHPFAGSTPTRYIYLVQTQGVPIDETLPERQQQLFRGLLAIDPKKRWSYAQVSDWLEGKEAAVEHESPVVDEQKPSESNPDIKIVTPFSFQQAKFFSLHSLALAFSKDYESWKAGRQKLAKGNVTKWLGEQGQNREATFIEYEIAATNPDLFLFKFVQHYAPELPPTIFGIRLTLANILACAIDSCTEYHQSFLSPLTPAQKALVKLIRSGMLKDYLAVMQKNNVKYDKILDILQKARIGHARDIISVILQARSMQAQQPDIFDVLHVDSIEEIPPRRSNSPLSQALHENQYVSELTIPSLEANDISQLLSESDFPGRRATSVWGSVRDAPRPIQKILDDFMGIHDLIATAANNPKNQGSMGGTVIGSTVGSFWSALFSNTKSHK